MVLTYRAALLAALGVVVCALVVNGWAVVISAAVIAIVIAVDVALCPSPLKLRISRDGESSIRLGAETEVTVEVTNPLSKPVRLRLRDAWIPSAGARGGIEWLTVPPRQRRRHVTTLRPWRRGDRHAGPVVVRILGPLGIAGRQRAIDVPLRVRVLPPFNSRKHLPSRLQRLRELDGRATLLQRGQGTEFDSLREYVAGDDVRSIEWRATARSNTVVVKTWRPERDRHVLIVLDSGRTSAGRVDDEPKLDHAMDAALLLAALASRAGDRVDMIIVDRELRASVVKTAQGELLNAMVNAMANVEPLLAESNYRLMVREVLQRVSQRSFVVLLTGLEGASITDGLLPVLTPLRRKHRVAVASVSDPRLDELVATKETAADAYAAAAAEAELARKGALADHLRRLGVTVVSSPPARIAPDLADHYLELKKAGQL